MRTPSSDQPILSELKEMVLDTHFGKEQAYVTVNERMIDIDDQLYLIVDGLERQHAEDNVFFSILRSSTLELLESYVPKDVEPAMWLEYIDSIKEDKQLDDYTATRMIQQLIDWDSYICDMYESVPEGSSPLSAKPIFKYMTKEDENNPINPDVDPESFMIWDLERTFYIIPLVAHPSTLLETHCKNIAASGLLVLSEDQLPVYKAEGSDPIHPEEFTLTGDSTKSILEGLDKVIETLNQEDHDVIRTKLYISTRGIDVIASQDEGVADAYSGIFSVLLSSEKLTPVVSEK